MSKDITKHAGGRPTLYTPQVIVEMNEYLQEAIPQNMKIPTIEGIALKLGISRDTLYEWAKKHKEFSDTLEELKMRQKESLTEIGIFGGKEINAAIVALLLKVNHGMSEGDGGPRVNILVIPGELAEKYGVALDAKISS